MRPSVQRVPSSEGCRSRERRSPSSTFDSDETELSDDSSVHGRQVHAHKKNSTAKERRGEGEREKGWSYALREGRSERKSNEGSSSEETDGEVNGWRKVEEEPDDEEIEWPRSESNSLVEGTDGIEIRRTNRIGEEMNGLMPAHPKRRSLPPERFKSDSEPRSIASSRNSVDRNKQKENKQLYQNLMERSKKLGHRQKKKFKKRREEDQDSNVKDPQIDVEVYERGRRENAEIWDKRAAEEGEGEGWTIDYLVATEHRPIGDPLKNETNVMIKWTDYPHPTWEAISQMINHGVSMREFIERVADMDVVEFNLRSTLGDAEFERRFPNRYLKRGDGVGNFGYITNKRSHYVNRLRALESRWTFLNDRAGLPSVYIEDWSDEQEDDESLRNLQYINYLVMTATAKKKITELPNQLEHIKCEADCGCCVGQRKKAGKKCCDTRGYEIGEGDYISVECTSSCGCDESCKNRVVQNGRKMRLSLFREPNKGWGVRVLKEVQKNEFIEEYTGEMALEAGKYIYDFPGSYPAKETDGSGKKLFSLVNRAGEKGNIARFFNHSCNPNLHAYNVLIERYGRFYMHTGFFAARKIHAGEELTFNYFDSDENDISEMLPNGCRCGAKKCKMPPEYFLPINEEEDDVGGDEMEDGMPQEENDEERERHSPHDARSIREPTNETMTGIEEKRGKRRPRKGPNAHSGYTDDESEEEDGRTRGRRSSRRDFDLSMEECPFSPLRESPSREDSRGDEEDSGRAEERRPSLGGATQRDEETQSQRLMTLNQFQRGVAVPRKRKQNTMKKALNHVKKEQMPPIPFDRHSSVDSDERERGAGIERRAEEQEEDSEVNASTIGNSHGRMERTRSPSVESDRSITIITLD